MSVRTDDLADRLRAADPLRSAAPTMGPADVLASILATPRRRRSPSRRTVRRPLLLAAVLALLAVAGLALAGTFSVDYFGSSSTVVPKPVNQALERVAGRYAPHGRLAVDRAILGYTFASASQRGRVFMAPYADRSGFCAALDLAGKPVAASCSPGQPGSSAPVTVGPFQPWSLSLTPAIHAMLGRLPTTGADERVEMVFEDGSRQELPQHGEWFAYAVAGRHTMPGHRPTGLLFLEHGTVARRSRLAPTFFNTLAEARALVPKSDGSRAQNAVHAILWSDLSSGLSDGGALASHVDLARTARVARRSFAGARAVSVYATPVRAHDHLPQSSIVLALMDGVERPLFWQNGIGMPRGLRFSGPFWATLALPHHPRSMFWLMGATTPRAVRRVSVQLSDGTTSRAVTYLGGSQWLWLGKRQPGVRPVGLVGRDAHGTIVQHYTLRRIH